MSFLREFLSSARPAFVASLRCLVAGLVLFVVFFAVVLCVLRFVDPPTSAVMVRDKLAGARVKYQWVPLERISPNLVRSVISSEDARFCQHNGIDWHEFRRAMRDADRYGIEAVRGASTITMQVAKNLFLWTDRSLARKALEIAITPLIELIWPKRRILEVYLNIAQWGPAVFGAEMAARHHFRRAPIDLTRQQAALLTASLPAPAVRKAGRATRYTQRIARRIRHRMRPGNVRTDCVIRR